MFTAALVIYFKPEWAIIDPICTFIFSVLVLATTVSILRNTLEVLMEAAPAGISHDVVEVSVYTQLFIGLLVYLHDQTGYTTNNYLVSCRISR